MIFLLTVLRFDLSHVRENEFKLRFLRAFDLIYFCDHDSKILGYF